ncbi:MAG: GNAT family N-acetyltransferase [Propionivibrio sp.]|uniref:GNAT family N-acetyltransferase n=1 Tax=Candidatus Propionivibrio dominans TaxID=2954373 RepID=A0A9D7F9D8_9RHOO|nr:GNAT family N-acetyltransferase [Candidatus Propionivibrio dominans]
MNQLSPDSRRHRYFRAVADFSDEMVTDLVVIDPLKQWAVLVVHVEKGIEIAVAGGRFVAESDITCEFSLLVDDRWQGQGVGEHILLALIGEASHRGLTKMTGYVLSENSSMIALARSMDFQVNESEEGESVKKLIRSLHRPSAGKLDRLARKVFGRGGKTTPVKAVREPPGFESEKN